jgi:hypothetical protein
MSNIRIDKTKALKKWGPVLENMGVQSEEKLDWMSEYAEYHAINENAYINASISGMGAVQSPQPSVFAGSTLNASPYTNTNYTLSNTGNVGSGDLGQNLLPVAMKIAAQTIGLDLVSVKPSPGPKLDLLYIDFQYDDVDTTQANPLVFKLTTNFQGGDNVDGNIATILKNMVTNAGSTLNVGGYNPTTSGWRFFVSFSSIGAAGLTAAYGGTGTYSAQPSPMTLPTNLTGIGEFLGFSRIDGLPIFKSFRQANAFGPMAYGSTTQFNGQSSTLNTFNATSAMSSQITSVAGQSLSYAPQIQLVSALEDQLPGYSTNFTANSQNGRYPMSRLEDDQTYTGNIGPKVSTKSIAVGTIEVGSSLRRTEIEDIKANTGMDIVQKMESILVNELSQTISKQIIYKLFEMGDLNRKTAPLFTGNINVNSISGATVFDLDTAYATYTNGSSISAPGGETTHAIQRKLITKMVHASNYIATEGRVGPAQFAVTNGSLAASLMDIAGYTINPTKNKINGSGQLYPVGQVGDIQVYVDPYMRYDDTRILVGRKNNPDQPGIIFVPYLMAQSISIISEATFAPRMLLRSRYAVSEVGWYPQKQYMTIQVKDAAQLLN